MKQKAIIILALFVAVLWTNEVNAQMSKKERKEWKKRLKSLEPEDYKNLMEENRDLSKEVDQLTGEVASQGEKLSQQEEELTKYQDYTSLLKAQLAEARKAARKDNAVDDSVTYDMSGIVFKVQIGALKNLDLSDYAGSTPNFSSEKNEYGFNEYTIGYFRDYWEADQFKKYIRKMGVKDAWVIPFKDGERVDLKEILSTIPPASTDAE